MNVLHVSSVRNRPQSGVANVVPKYLEHQSRHANVALLNIDAYTPPGAEKSYPIFHYTKGFDLEQHSNPVVKSPDIVVFHEVYWPQFIGIAKHYRKKGIPYIIIPHVSLTDTAQNKKRLKKTVGNFLLFGSFISNALAIQFLSQSEKEQTSRFTHVKSFIRSNGIDIQGRKKTHFNDDRLRLIYVGRYDYKIKGLDRLIEAVNLIQTEMRQRDIRVALYGTDEGDSLVRINENIKRYSLEDLIHVNDGLFGEAKREAILSSDCFIQLSRTEGQPLGIMEAMDIGMPCIVTEGTTFHEVARQFQAGIPVSDDAKAIGDTLLAIRDGAYDLESISQNASDYTKTHYGWESVSKLMIDDYERLINHA
ncbi:hypothetical protein CR983_00075 [Candidatus Saccharibacteria bacterium]|nr:MAG: hypothetical protein CR983_00075 [Candidatus Saccharibacteria bacterium]